MMSLERHNISSWNLPSIMYRLDVINLIFAQEPVQHNDVIGTSQHFQLKPT